MRGSFVRWIGVAAAAVVLTAAPAFAQTASPSATPTLLPVPKASPSWTIYMAYLTIGIAVLTLIMTALGFMMQAPGFRRTERPARPAGPPQAS